MNGVNDSVANAVLEKILFDPAASAQYRTKMKLTEPSAAVKEQVGTMNYRTLLEDPLGRFYYFKWVSDVLPAQGAFLMGVMRTKLEKKRKEEKRELAKQLVEGFVKTVDDIFSADTVEELVSRAKGSDAGGYAGRRSSQRASTGDAKSESGRKGERASKMAEAKEYADEAMKRLNQSSSKVPYDLFDDMWLLAIHEADKMYTGWKSSPHFTQYCQYTQLESTHVTDDDFKSFRVLGVGGFGSVKAAMKKDTGVVYAIKFMDKKLIKHKNRYKSCYTEVNALKHVKSPFICGLHYCYQTKDDVCIVLDLLPGGTLGYLLHKKKRIAEKHVVFFTACIIQAYEALHSAGFVYRDMKPANVVLKSNGYCCLIDFGLAAPVTKSALKGKCGTRGYWSPEMVKGDQYLLSGDLWSLGVMLIELISGKKPFKRKLQRYKNTEDKVQVVMAGEMDDAIEEKDIEQKIGKATQEDNDGRDSDEEETDAEEEEEAVKKAAEAAAAAGAAAGGRRRTSLRVIGGFDKTISSTVDLEQTVELLAACLPSSTRPALAAIAIDDLILTGPSRLYKLLSVVLVEEGAVVFEAGQQATFLAVVISGSVVSDDGQTIEAGSLVGDEGLLTPGCSRASTIKAASSCKLGVLLYAEMMRARLFDAECVRLLVKAMVGVAPPTPTRDGAKPEELVEVEAETKVYAQIQAAGESETELAVEKLIAALTEAARKSTASNPEKKDKKKDKELSAGKQRDMKIYLTQEVWIKKEYISNDGVRFIKGLMTRDVNKRLGCGTSNWAKLRGEPFFKDIKWKELENQVQNAPFLPKEEINAKDESEMKVFNTKGMKSLTKEDQTMWDEWDWNSPKHFQEEMVDFLMVEYEKELKYKGKGGGGGGGGGGCCTVS